jgi:CheY-like chemotaxis protein
MIKLDTQLLMNPFTDMPSQYFNWHGKKIMIVEDDYANYLFFHEILSCSDASLIRAVSMQEAFDMLNSPAHFDLCIIKVDIAGNENCRSLRRIKQLWPDIPIIAITEGNCTGKIQQCDSPGCDTLLSYNVDEASVRHAVNEMF